MATPPKPIASKSIPGKVKSFLLRPALTSHFEVFITPPSGSENFFKDNGVVYSGEKLILMCSDATLPGSSLATHENNNDFTGVTERFAYRRIYDDRIDLGFYVDVQDHYTIRFFETWIKYVANEQISEKNPSGVGVEDSTYFYRFKYPDGPGGYRQGSALFVSKFERDYDKPRTKRLVYEFVKPYPISIQSMPVSYESSSLLKCTVSMTYLRYFLDPNKSQINGASSEPGQSTANTVSNSPFDLTAERQAQLNASFSQNFSLGNLSAGTLTNTNFDPLATAFNSQAFSGNLNLL